LANIHRIQWIDAQIRAGKYPNSNDIEKEFEISKRQVARDIEYMRYSLNAPIVYSRQNNGFGYNDNSFILPAFYLTEEEKSGLSYLSQRYASLNNKTAAVLSNLFSKLSSIKDSAIENSNDKIKVANISEIEIEVFNQLKKSISGRKKVKIEYINANMEKSSRIIHPYNLHIKNGNSFLDGYCELRKENRVFRLDRITVCKELEENFVVDDKNRLDDYNFRTGKKPFRSVIFFEKIPNREEYLEFNIKNGLCTVEFFNSEKLLNSLLSTGVKFRIISPNWLKTKLKDHLKDLLNYNEI